MESWRVEDEVSAEVDGIERIVVRIVAGEVTVTAGDEPRLEVKRESGSPVDVRFAEGGLLQVLQPESQSAPLDWLFKWFTTGWRHRCTVAITAPPDAQIEISTVSAPIVVSGFAGGTNVKTVSGDVTLSGLGRRVDVKTISGDVEAKGIAAELRMKSVSGDLAVVEGVCSTVAAKSVSGEVLLDLDLDPHGTYDINTVSGDVSVRTLSEPNLEVEAKTISGRVVSDFGLDWESRPGQRTVRDTIGDGGARLNVKTVSGDLRVLRGRAAA